LTAGGSDFRACLRRSTPAILPLFAAIADAGLGAAALLQGSIGKYWDAAERRRPQLRAEDTGANIAPRQWRRG
jgi:hypothetical protein